MEWLYPLLQAVQVISALSVIGLVLLQHGRGADMGTAFGAGSAGSVFGAAGAANFLSRATRWAAIIFFVVTAGLAWWVYHPKQAAEEAESVMQGFESVVPGAPGQIGGQGIEENSPPVQDPAVPTVPGAGNTQDETAERSAAVPSVPAAPEEQAADENDKASSADTDKDASD